MPTMQSPPGPETVIDGRTFLYFSGTGYLGLHGHPDVIRAACEATQQYGLGSATSRQGFGDVPPTLAVERSAAEFFNADTSFYFVSGYVGNHIVAQLLKDAFDHVFLDSSSHYSVQEAMQLSGLPVCPFHHAEPEDLQKQLGKHLRPGHRPLLVSDGVFAALGAIAPLRAYYQIMERFAGSGIHIDDAHGVGVLGKNGRGSYEHCGLAERGVNVALAANGGPSLFMSATLSKAVGGFGGILPISRNLFERVRATSHYYEGASALPPAVAAATHRALEIVRAEPMRRTRLWDNVRQLKQGLKNLGLAVDETPVPIINLTLESADQMRTLQGQLMDRGIVITYRGSYSGLDERGALRIAVFATHEPWMIEQLVGELRKIL